MKQVLFPIIFGLACSLLSLALGIIFRIAFLTALFRAGIFFLVGGFIFFVLMRIFSFTVSETEDDNEEDEDEVEEDSEDGMNSIDDVQLEYDPLQFGQLNIGKEVNYVSQKEKTRPVQSKKEDTRNKKDGRDRKDRENDEKELTMANNKKDIVVDIRGRKNIDDIPQSRIDTGDTGKDIQNIATNNDSFRSKNDQIEYNDETEKDFHEDSVERTLEVFTEQSKSEEMNRSAEKTRNAFQKDRGRFTNSLKHLINND